MLEGEEDLDSIRLRLIDLLESDECRLEEVADRTGRGWLRRYFNFPSQYNIFGHILDILHEDAKSLVIVRMGEPPGSRGIAYRVVDRKHLDLYIKVRIEEEKIVVISFHATKHSRGY